MPPLGNASVIPKFASQHGAWNLEPFTNYKKFSTKFFTLEGLGKVIAINPVSYRVLQASWDSPALTLHFIGPYPAVGFASEEPLPMGVTSKTYLLDPMSSIADIHWSSSQDLIYVLDASRPRLYVLDPTSDDSVASPREIVDIKLPPRVELSDASRFAFVPFPPEAPEDSDAFAYVSAPLKSVVLRLATTSGETEIVCGRVDRKGQPSSDSFAWEALLKSPGPLAYDGRTHCLFITDNENGEVYGVRADKRIFVLSDLPGSASHLLVYRAHDYLDPNALREKEGIVKDRSWGERPSLLLIVDRENNGILKIPLYGDTKTSTRKNRRRPKPGDESAGRGIKTCSRVIDRLFPEAQKIFALLNGDLLIGATNSRSYYMHIDLVQQSPVIDAFQS